MTKIYYLTDYTNIPKYIGKTKNILINRKNEHISSSKNSNRSTYKINWIKSVDYNITIHLIEECDDELSSDREIDYYSKLYKLTNGTKGGDVAHIGYKGRKCSDETKLKLSIANNGRILSDEWKEKISISGKGRIVSEETKKKISDYRTGKPHKRKGHKITEEISNKISIANKGRIYTDDEKKLILEKKKLTYDYCPNCGIHTSQTNLIRWYFDKCKKIIEK